VKVHVDKHGSLSSTFDLTCHGKGGSKRRFSLFTAQLALERGKLNRPVADVCQGGLVRVAFDQYNLIEVDTGDNRMVEYDLKWSIIQNRADSYEILSSFFNEHQLTPTFIDNKYTYPLWDTEAGLWTGVVAMVRANISIIDHV
jgi:hypothetical protein